MSTLLYQNGTSLFGKKENVFTVVSRISLFFSCFQQERKDLRGFAKLHAWQKGTLLHSGWKLLNKVSFYNIATNLMPPFWGCPPKRRHKVSNSKWDIFADFIPLCYYFQAKQNWKVGFWNGTLKSFLSSRLLSRVI